MEKIRFLILRLINFFRSFSLKKLMVILLLSTTFFSYISFSGSKVQANSSETSVITFAENQLIKIFNENKSWGAETATSPYVASILNDMRGMAQTGVAINSNFALNYTVVSDGFNMLLFVSPSVYDLDTMYRYNPVDISAGLNISQNYAKISKIHNSNSTSFTQNFKFIGSRQGYLYTKEYINFETRTSGLNSSYHYTLLPGTQTGFGVDSAYGYVEKFPLDYEKVVNSVYAFYNILVNKTEYNTLTKIKNASYASLKSAVWGQLGFSNDYQFNAWVELLEINKKLDNLNSSSSLNALLEETQLQTEAINRGNQLQEEFNNEMFDTDIKGETEQEVQDTLDFGDVTNDINNDYDSSLMGLINSIINKLTDIPDGEVTKSFNINVFGHQKSFTLSSNQLLDFLPIGFKTFFVAFWWFILGIPTAKLMYGLFVKIKTMKILDGFNVSGIIERII